MNSDADLTQFEIDSIENMTKSGYAKTQIVLTDAADVAHANASGFGFAVNPFYLKNNYGHLDTVGGLVYADKACRFALHMAERLGVQLILGGSKGTFSALLREPGSKIIGVQTADGVSYPADLTIMACGGWTPSLIPDLDNLCETTCGSVSIFQLPPGSPLWDRFAPENFPTWS
jgi:sarcosine oxidase / L-pipecolate oxidase